VAPNITTVKKIFGLVRSVAYHGWYYTQIHGAFPPPYDQLPTGGCMLYLDDGQGWPLW